MEKESESLAKIIVDWLSKSDSPEKSDIIFVFGGIRLPAVWERAADLYLSKYAPLILATGGFGPLAKEIESKIPESFVTKEYLIKRGVPEAAILEEDKSVNTLENVLFGMKKLQGGDMNIKKAILVAKPFHMKRCAATFKKQFPEVDVLACPPQGTMNELMDRPQNEFYKRMLGELDRLKNYADKGDVARLEIPEEVKSAASKLEKLLSINS